MANRVLLTAYQRKGKKLIPFLLTIPKLKLESWANSRLPEMLWAILIRKYLDQMDALRLFSQIGDCFYAHKYRIDITPDITLSGIGKQPGDFQEKILDIICNTQTSPLLGTMLVFDTLPAKSAWKKRVPKINEEEAWPLLADAVVHCLDHQSVEATDCRVAKIIPYIAMGHLGFVKGGPSEENVSEIINDLNRYPFGEDTVRAKSWIRALEILLTGAIRDGTGEDQNWSELFWQECHERTLCLPFDSQSEIACIKIGDDTVELVRSQLLLHSDLTISTTGKDPKHEAVFGIGFYAINLLSDLIENNLQNTSTGRIVLRTLCESLIILKWLTIKDDYELWEAYRKYGCGQAKLQAVKLEENSIKVSYADIKTLIEIANEDQWDRFLEIELGPWSSTTIRQMSEDANVKDIYDLFYNWGSTYAHAGWGAIRESNYQNCVNPLHRFHQIPVQKQNKLPSVLPDALILSNMILDIISDQYPTFEPRFEIDF